MNIRTRLYINSAITLASITILLVLILQFSINFDAEMNKSAVANSLVKDTTELILLTNEYLKLYNERSEKQWHYKYDQITKTLTDTDSLKASAPTFTYLKLLKEYFIRIKAEHILKQGLLKNKTPIIEIEKIEYSQKMLSDQINVNTQEIQLTMYKMVDEAEVVMRKIRTRSNYTIIIFAILLIIVSVINSIVSINSITTPLLRLVEGVKSIESNNFQNQIPVKKQKPFFTRLDEVNQLTEAFNNMARRLDLSFSNLHEKVKEREILLQEIHHRVKNNMQVIASLLKLQANSLEDGQVKDVLKESQSRVYAMSAVHEILHGSENLSEIELKSYVSIIATSIFQTYSVNPNRVKLKYNISKAPININQASPIGLIVNELISNSLKYAFPNERKGEITVGLKKLDQEFELIFKDDGVGMPNDFDWKKANTLGIKLVRALAENQLDGSIDMESENGTTFIIKFNIEV